MSARWKLIIDEAESEARSVRLLLTAALFPVALLMAKIEFIGSASDSFKLIASVTVIAGALSILATFYTYGELMSLISRIKGRAVEAKEELEVDKFALDERNKIEFSSEKLALLAEIGLFSSYLGMATFIVLSIWA